MVWFDKLKLNKQLVRSVNEAGYTNPKEVQLKTLARITGGQDLIVISPESSGKTTAYVLGVLNRFNHAPEGVPRVLILVPEQEQVEAVLAQFNLLNKNKSISVVGLYVTPGMEAQMNALAEGADIVVATPDRARAIYLKLGLNLNKIDLFIVDDADQLIKKGMQLPVVELANSITKCQHLVFSDVWHSRLEKMVSPFMKQPAIIEIEEFEETALQTYEQLLYLVPNFGTKLNLLNLFVSDRELFSKTVVFTNAAATAEKIYKSLDKPTQNRTAARNLSQILTNSCENISDFIATDELSLLIVSGDNEADNELTGIPFIIHFDLPAEKETFLARITNHEPGNEKETLAITFATDLEMSQVKRIEQASGKKIPLADLPDELLIEKDPNIKKDEVKPAAKTNQPPAGAGAAFHEKKPSNAKTYNYSSGLKAKMSNKRKHS